MTEMTPGKNLYFELNSALDKRDYQSIISIMDSTDFWKKDNKDFFKKCLLALDVPFAILERISSNSININEKVGDNGNIFLFGDYSLNGLDFLLKNGINVKSRNKGKNVIHHLIGSINSPDIKLSMIDKIVDCGIDINCRDSSGNTVIHHVFNSEMGPVAFDAILNGLLDRGADPMLRNYQGANALNKALDSYKGNLARILKYEGIVEIGSGVETEILNYCCSSESIKELQLLIDNHGLNAENDQYNLLHRAVKKDFSDAVVFLISKGWSSDAMDYNGSRPFDGKLKNKCASIWKSIQCHKEAVDVISELIPGIKGPKP